MASPKFHRAFYALVAGMALLPVPSCLADAPPREAPPTSSPSPAGAPGVRARLVQPLSLEIVGADGAPVMNAGVEPLWQPDGRAGKGLRVEARLDEVADGFDLAFTMTNAGTDRVPPGRIALAGFRFGTRLQARDFRHDGKPMVVDYGGGARSPGGWYYPDGLYSPVAVFGDSALVVGVSLLYPVLEYKHQVRIGYSTVRAPVANARDVVWTVDFNLNPEGNEGAKHSEAGDLAPGESRLYTVAVRFSRDPARWLDTLAPYAAYFHEKYGPVKYSRDPRPVAAYTAAGSGQIGPDNPYGFRQQRLRPDLHGYGPWADHIIQSGQAGWRRSMLWMAAGQTDRVDDKIIPWKFATQWGERLQAGNRMADFKFELPRIGRSGVDFGLWWSRSAQVATSWSPPTYEELDPSNPDHVRLARADLDAALKAGATTIGLDAFRKMDIWLAFDWLQQLQSFAPGVKFIVEPPLGDVMHTLAPCFLLATRPGEGELRLEHRHYLADLLNPGHETWGLIRLDRFESYLKRRPTPRDISTEMRRVAALGYVPVVAAGESIDRTIIAAESWRTLPPPSVDPAPRAAARDGETDLGDRDDEPAPKGKKRDREDRPRPE